MAVNLSNEREFCRSLVTGHLGRDLSRSQPPAGDEFLVDGLSRHVGSAAGFDSSGGFEMFKALWMS